MKIKKILLTISFVILAFANAMGQPELFAPKAADEGLKGPVHVVQTVQHYDYNNQDVYPSSSTVAYGHNGLLMYKTYFSFIGITETFKYMSDEQGRLTDIMFDSGTSGYHFIYSKKGHLKYIIDDANPNDTLQVTAYDKQGRTLELSQHGKAKYRYAYYPDGSLFSTEYIDSWITYYNMQGRIDSIRAYYGFKRYVYSENGEEMIEINNSAQVGDAPDTVIHRLNYQNVELDRYGNWISADYVKDSIHYYVRRHIIYYEDDKK